MQNTPEHFFWLQTGFLGDIILTTAALDLSVRKFPESKNVLITTPLGKAALKDHPAIAQTIVFDKRGSGTFRSFQEVRRQVRGLGQGVLLQAHSSHRSSFLAQWCAVPRVTYKENPIRLGARHRVDRVAVWHEAHRIGVLLEDFGVERSEILTSKPILPESPTTELNDRQQQFFRQYHNRLLAIAPGSVWGTKRWPLEKFVELVGKLRHEPETRDSGIVLLGSGGERALTAEIVRHCREDDQILDLAGATTLDDLRWIYPKLGLLVSNDSSPIHYASAFQIPTVALFGATIPAMGFGPLAENSVSLGVELDCRPCSDHGPQQCPLGHFRCMRELTVESVWAAIKSRI